MKRLIALLLSIVGSQCLAQDFTFEKTEGIDSITQSVQMQSFAKKYLSYSENNQKEIDPVDRYRIQLIAGDYPSTIATIQVAKK